MQKFCLDILTGLGQNALSLTLGTAAAPSSTANEGLGGIDFSSSSDKKSKFVFKIFKIDNVYSNLLTNYECYSRDTISLLGIWNQSCWF